MLALRSAVPLAFAAAPVLVVSSLAPAFDQEHFAAAKAAAFAALALLLNLALPSRWPDRFSVAGAVFCAYVGCAAIAALAGAAPASFAAQSVAIDVAIFGFVRAYGVARREGIVSDDKIALGIVAAGCIIALPTVAEALGARLWGGLARRPVSLVGSRNAVAAVCAIALPFAIHRARNAHMLPAAGTAAVLAFAVSVGRCRSVLVGMIPLLAFGLWRLASSRERHMAVALGAALGGATAALALPWPGFTWVAERELATHPLRLLGIHADSGGARLANYRLLREVFWENPWFGVGQRAWHRVQQEHAHAIGPHAPPFVDDMAPKSELIRYLAESGLFGGGLFLLYLGVCAWGLWRARARGSSIAGTALLALVPALAYGLADELLLRAETACLVAVTLAFGEPQFLAARWSTEWRTRFSRLAVVGILTVAVSLCGMRLVAIELATYGQTALAFRLYPSPRLLEGLARRPSSMRDAWLDEALRRCPHSWGLRIHRAVRLGRAGDPGGARREIALARRQEPHLGSVALAPDLQIAWNEAVRRGWVDEAL